MFGLPGMGCPSAPASRSRKGSRKGSGSPNVDQLPCSSLNLRGTRIERGKKEKKRRGACNRRLRPGLNAAVVLRPRPYHGGEKKRGEPGHSRAWPCPDPASFTWVKKKKKGEKGRTALCLSGSAKKVDDFGRSISLGKKKEGSAVNHPVYRLRGTTLLPTGMKPGREKKKERRRAPASFYLKRLGNRRGGKKKRGGGKRRGTGLIPLT